MKNINSKKIGFCILILSSAFAARASHLGDKLFFSAKMNGQQEVPAVTTNGQGVASLTLNHTRDTLCINVYMAGLSGAVEGIHIHSGMMGVSGSVAQDLSPNLSGNTVHAMITGSDLSAQFISDLINGGLYINAHTANFGGGEIRGQIKLETDWAIQSVLTTDQETSMPASTANGLASMNVSLDKKMLNVYVVANNLTGAIGGAHVHYGAAGQDGNVVADLTDLISGNGISGFVDISATPELIDSIMLGHAYVNLHTTANPAGEIRGQLMFASGINFDTWMNTAQQVTPPTGSMAIGTGYFSLSPAFDQLTYRLEINGASGAITGAHLHNGALGVDGGVVADLSSGINGNTIMGTLSGAALTDALIENLLMGNIYVNAHTMMNMNGEVRGQVYRLAREGYTVDMTGEQQVPAITTAAYGGGIVSINRDQNSLHYMFVAGDLSGMIQGAHFHNAAMGASGGVIFDLSASFAGVDNYDGAYGYLTGLDAAPFTSTQSLMFRNEMVYVNVHTAANAGGEIRGQVLRNAPCMETVLAVDELELTETSVYPNPFASTFRIMDQGTVSNLSIRDITGKNVDFTFDATSMEVELKTLETGLYFVNYTSNGQLLNIKVLKK